MEKKKGRKKKERSGEKRRGEKREQQRREEKYIKTKKEGVENRKEERRRGKVKRNGSKMKRKGSKEIKSREEIRREEKTNSTFLYLARCQHVVHVLEKSFVFDFVVCEYKRDAFSLMTSSSVQHLEVVHQIADVVGSTTKINDRSLL